MNSSVRHRRLSSALILAIGVFLAPHTPASGQSREQMKAEAEGQLRQMTPEEIDRKIKELGLTREEAVRKAAELGIPLEQFLSGSRGVAIQKEFPPSAAPGVEPATPADTVARVPPAPPALSPSGLPYFGYDIFSNIPAAFEPTASGPADPEYVIGPGDVLRVTVWGQAEFQNELTVDREGRIFISTVGEVPVSGLTLEQAYGKLLKQLSRSYSGLIAKQPTVWLDVTIARLRPKRVFIMGEVAKPGGYTVSSYATVFNSLYSVGGPTVHGSLREVRVIRGDRVIDRVDLYDYLLGAEQTNDFRVQNNDIIFVPVRGKSVSMRGAVQRPAVYELKEDENLASLLRFCGGLLPTAYAANAQIERINPFEKRTGSIEDRIVVDVDLRPLLKKAGGDTPLYDGDNVQIFPILEETYNYVTVTGSVWRPGRYELGQVHTLRDLIAAAKGVQPKTYMDLAHLVRLNEDLVTYRIIGLDLRKVLEDEQYNMRLLPRDELVIYSTEITEIRNKFVTIRGEVKSPGRYPLRTNLSLQDLIAEAGGYTDAAQVLQAEVSRIMPKGSEGDSLALLLHPKIPARFSVEFSGDTPDSAAPGAAEKERSFLLQHRDEVYIYADPQFKVQENVSVTGDFTYPGVYAIHHRDERLSEILDRAGGPTKTSYLGGAELYRRGRRVLVDFARAYKDKNPSNDVIVFPGDSIAVPMRPHTVLVSGEVNRTGLLSFIDGDAVSDYIDRAGGLTDSASYALLTKPTGETRRVNFGFLRDNPDVPDGSAISVQKVPAPRPETGGGETLATTVKDIFAIVTSAATVAFIVWQVRK